MLERGLLTDFSSEALTELGRLQIHTQYIGVCRCDDIPDAIYDASLDELRARVQHEYGDLDQQIKDEVLFVIAGLH